MAKELAIIQEYPVLARSEEQLREVIAQNVGAGTLNEFDLDRLKVPSGGGTYWAIPQLDGKAKPVEQIKGIVIHWKDVRAYWKTPFAESGGGSPPDCASQDSFTGFGDPGGDCVKCPLAQFGSAPDPKSENGFGLGQACKAMRVLFLLSEDLFLPRVIACPPTSLRSIKQFFLRLTSNMVPYDRVIMSLRLEEDKNAKGIQYAKIVPSLIRTLEPEEYDKVKTYANALRPAFEAPVDLSRAEYQEAANA